MPDFSAIIFDFDGVLLESEYEGNRELAALLTEFGHEHSVEDTLQLYVGLSGGSFIGAIEQKIGSRLPPDFHDRLRVMSVRALREGVAAVTGAVEFVRSLPVDTPKAVASSSSTRWVRGHLDHLKLSDAFGDHVYSGREHVERGKPAPDLYLFAARQLGVAIEDCVIIDDSRVGATGALASGARVIGLAAGAHCLAGHDEMLRSIGVDDIAHDFDEVRALLSLA
jgi:HAD superfamily hydrolase (TIGR01509 family)